KVLIMVPQYEENLIRASGNLPGVHLTLAAYLSLVEMLRADVVVLPRESVAVIETILTSTGGRTPHTVELPEGVIAPASAPSPIQHRVEQMDEASDVTAAVVTEHEASHGVEAAQAEAAEAYDAAAVGADEDSAADDAVESADAAAYEAGLDEDAAAGEEA